MAGQLLNVTQAAAALDAPLGSLGDESSPAAMAGCALEATRRESTGVFGHGYCVRLLVAWHIRVVASC